MNETYIQLQEDRATLTHPSDIPGGSVPAIPSKSHAHRLLIAAALSKDPCRLVCPATSKDIEATAACLSAMGARIERTEDGYFCYGVSATESEDNAAPEDAAVPEAAVSGTPRQITLPVGESGSTLRFLLPVVGALGRSASFYMEGRLSQRPLSPLYEEMCRHGVTLSPIGDNPLRISGQLTAGEYVIDGGVSSQYITGLLFALPLLKEDSRLVITGRLESAPYVEITLQVLRQFGIRIEAEEQDGIIYNISGGQQYHLTDDAPVCRVEGDWSNAAFFLSAGALLKQPVTVTGCNLHSPQGDRQILELLKQFGAEITAQESLSDSGLSDITVVGGALKAARIDARDIPDLVPILSVVAAYAEGSTEIQNIERLRIKESDRVATVMEMLRNLGSSVELREKTPECGLTLRITGREFLQGGTVSSYNDHRIAMAAAIASLRANGPVDILQPMAVRKSYPGFYEDLVSILEK